MPIDYPELKFWWIKKCLARVQFFETSDGKLNFDKLRLNHYDLSSMVENIHTSALVEMLNSYFIVPWAGESLFSSHEEARHKIQDEFLKVKVAIIDYVQCYTPPQENRIEDFALFFDLSEDEVEILYYGLIEAYTLGSGFTLSTLKSNNLYEKISTITGLQIDTIKKCLSTDSKLLKENIFTVIDDNFSFNLNWDEYFFEGQVSFKREMLNYNTKLEFKERCRLKRARYDISFPVIDFLKNNFSYIRCIDRLVAYDCENMIRIRFDFSEKIEGYSFWNAVFKLGIYRKFSSLKYEVDSLNSSRIINGYFLVFFSEQDFLSIKHEIESQNSEFFNSQLLSKISIK